MNSQSRKKEAFSRVVIDVQLKDVGWNLIDGQSVRFEYQLPDGTFADYVLSDRHGRAMAIVEAKRAAIDPIEGKLVSTGTIPNRETPRCL